jgi:hypothetical protein
MSAADSGQWVYSTAAAAASACVEEELMRPKRNPTVTVILKRRYRLRLYLDLT